MGFNSGFKGLIRLCDEKILLVIQIQSISILAATFQMLRQIFHPDLKRNMTCCQKPQKRL